MRCEHRGEASVMVLCQPQREDVELVIAGKHRIKRRQIPERLLHDLCTCIHKDAMDRRYRIPELFFASACQQGAQGKLALRLLIEGTNNFAQVIYIAVRGPSSRSRFECCGIATAHHSSKYAYLEK